jgi:arylsulfatase A-like enzyme
MAHLHSDTWQRIAASRSFRRGGVLTPIVAATACGLSFAVGIHAATVEHAGAAPSRPNVIVVETDDQTAESIRVMRNVNALIGGQGATFKNNFVNHSLCCPSRATFLTGQYEHNHGIVDNEGQQGGFVRFQALHRDNHLGVWLENAGYYTATIGRYLNGYDNLNVPPGWSEWHVAIGRGQAVYNYNLNENGAKVFYGQKPADFKQDVFSRLAVNFVNRRAPQAQPFFLWLTYTAVHVAGPNPNPNPPSDCAGTAHPAPRHAHAFDSEPLPMSPNFNEADVSDKPAAIRGLPRLSAGQIADIRRTYRCELESLLSVDEGVKRIVDALAANHELGNTLLVYTSDNGYFHGAHRVPREKGRIYDESIRVPLQIRGPGIPKGTDIRALSTNADLAPTVVDAANATPGLPMDGRTLIPVAQDPAVAQGRELLVEQPNFAAIRTGRYMYVEWNNGERELYDLSNDPFELRSRHATPAYASVRAQLAARLHELKDCAGPSCRADP